jgi:hypothetical protein
MVCNSHRIGRIDPGHSKIIACAAVIEEMLPIMPPQMNYEVLDFSLHVNPDELRITLQSAINASASSTETIILGYGLCARAVVGLKAEDCTLIVPRVDDCIAIFLGSQSVYYKEQRSVPGTYYLTKGWLKSGDTLFDECDVLTKQYGQDKARFLINQILKNYARLVFIDTGQPDLGSYRAQAHDIAERFGLRYEEIQGSDTLIRKMIFGPWDDDFVIVHPGQAISFSDFFSEDKPTC